MTNDKTDSDREPNRVEELVDEYLRHLEEGIPTPDLAGLSAAERSELRELFELLEATWGSEVLVPPLEEDPVALRLGFVAAPSQTVALDGTKVKAHRQASHIDARQLVSAAANNGAAIELKDLVMAERRQLWELPVGDAAALADALHCPMATLAAATSEVDDFVAFLYSDDFDNAVAQWAKENQQDVRELASKARQLMLTSARRSHGEGQLDDWLALLHTVLETLT